MTQPTISIIDYGVGNLNSVANMIRRVGAGVRLVRTPEEIECAERLVLPGVGAFDSCRHSLDKIVGMEAAIRNAVARRVPLLGICVGMQMLATSSEEGSLPGLDIIPGRVRRFNLDTSNSFSSLRVPHMGWSVVTPRGKASLFTGTLSELNRFYFVHSYYFECQNPDDEAGASVHGHKFTAAVEHGSVYGAQFHPEKSHRYGLIFFRNFASLQSGKDYA